MRARRTALSLAATTAVVVAACASTAPMQEVAPASDTGTVSAPGHSAHADALREVMRSFDAEVRKGVPGEVDLHDRWEGTYQRMAEAADRLEASARSLAGHPPKGLELPARGRFSVRGRALSDAATKLEEAASRNDADAVEIARREVAVACRNCHREFRDDHSEIPEAFE
jgi:hypothetical protein